MPVWDNATGAPLCSFGCDGWMHKGKQIGLLQRIFLGLLQWRAAVFRWDRDGAVRGQD